MRWLEALATLSGVAACVGALFAGDGNSPELSEGLLRMQSLVQEENFEGALAEGQALLAPNRFSEWRREKELDEARVIVPLLNFADPALDLYRITGTTREERAHIHFALGVAQLAAGDPQEAVREFGDAHTRAGAGELREDAAYNLGTIHLLAGENWRAQIPELGGQPPAPAAQAAPPAPGAAPAGADAEPPDPLEQARAAYLTALEHFIGRLRLDWQDADTRANTELVLRRLRELERIEQEREQQEQEDQQQQDQSKDQQKQDQQDPSEKEDKQDQQQEQQQEPEQQPGDEKPEEEPQPEEGEQEPQDSEEQPAEAGEEAPKPAPQEVFLTKEEVQRLLDQLKDHEEQGKELRERARAKRQRPTARDW